MIDTTKPTKNETLEQRVADLTAKVEATEQRAATAEAALNDRRTDEERYVDAGAATIAAVLKRDVGWRGADPAS